MKSLKFLSVLASLALAVSAQATSLSLADALGSIDPATPSNPINEVTYINNLINSSDATIDGKNYTRNAGISDWTIYPDAVETGSVKQEAEIDDGMGGKIPNPNFTPANIDVSGWAYLVGKYGTTLYVWYVATLADGVASIPVPRLSHYSLYNPTTTNVPDAASTLALLALGLGSLGLIARRRKA